MPRRRLSDALAPLLGAVLAVMGAAAIYWPMPLHLRTHEALGAFQPGHTWAFAYMARIVSGDAPLTVTEIGFPASQQAQFIAWIPALLVAPLQGALGSIGAYNVASLLGPPLSAIGAWLFFRRVAEAPSWLAALAGLTYSLSPYMIGCLASGQTCKAQVWVIPVALWAFHRAVDPELRLSRTLPVLAAVLFAGAFSEPSYVLYVVPALVLWWPLLVAEGPRRGARLLQGGIALATAAAALLPARAYYAAATGSGVGQVFLPARRPPATDVGGSVATVGATFLGDLDLPVDTIASAHVTYLPAVLLVAAALLLPFSGRPGRSAVVLGGVGLVLAFGEVLIWDSAPWVVDGHVYTLPAAWLARYGYPLASSGMYYRGIALGQLGLQLVVVGGLARLGARATRGPAVALVASVALAVHGGLLAQGTAAVRTLFPRVVQRVPGLDLYTRMRADPVPGGVLDLPAGHEHYAGQSYARAATLHGRSTNGLGRAVRPRESPALDRLLWSLDVALEGPSPAEALAAKGLRYVVWHERSNRLAGPDLVAITAALGVPERIDGLLVWVLPPAVPR
ncbi:MAG: hypothetical protein Q8P18_13045 [Pseudomonadota bacterium]|nr:hypothetical protein [Pseudomonadota bacterium]